jgi:transposase
LKKKYFVNLSEQEVFELKDIVSQAHHPPQKRKRAQALLLANEAVRSDSEIAEIVRMNNHSITELRKRFVTNGYSLALNSSPHRRRPKALDDTNEERLLDLAKMMADSESKISLRRLASVFITSDGRRVSHETIRQTLKKNEMNI